MKKFFGINENFRFEWDNLSALLTVMNVSLILMDFWVAPIFGLVNCAVNLFRLPQGQGHVNMYTMNLALIVLNLYFLFG